LKPKKPSDIIKRTIEKTGESEELVELVVDNFWKYVRKNLTSLEARRYRISHLGTFIVRQQKAEETRERLQEIKDRLSASPKINKITFTKIKKINEQIEKFDKLFEQRRKELEAIASTKLRKKAYEESRKNSLEQQGTDLRGSEEHSI